MVNAARCVRAFEQEFDFLYRLLRRYGVHDNDAEDLVQEVFAVMCRRWADYQSERPLRPWLAGIAVHLAYKYRERGCREVPSSCDTALGEARAGVYEGIDDRLAARALLERALASIPAVNRTAMVLHVLEGLTVREVAEALSIPLATAYTRIGRARRAFMEHARHLTGDSPVSQRRRLLLAPMALLDPGESPTSPPAWLRRRAVARARTHMLRATGPRLMPVGTPLRTVGAVAATIAMVVIGVWRVRAPDPGEPPVSGGRRAADSGRRTDGMAAAAAMERARVHRRLAVLSSALPRPPALAAYRLPDGASLARGLSGYWRFDEGAGATSHDLSGQGNDCRLVGMDIGDAWASGVMSESLRFTARGRTVCPLPRQDGTAESTVAVWVRRHARKAYKQTLVAREDGDRQRYLMLGLHKDMLLLEAAAWRTSLRAPLPVGGGHSWMHVAFSYSEADARGELRLYLDGVEVDAVANLRPPDRSPASFMTIGLAWHPMKQTWWQGFRGQIDELTVYHRTLSGSEIAALASSRQPQL